MMGSCWACFIAGNFAARLFDFYMFQNCLFSYNEKSIVLIGGSQSRKLASRQGFRQYFQCFEFSFYAPGLKLKTFYIVRRCASVWRGPGFFWSCIRRERTHLKMGFGRACFHEIRRANGFWCQNTKSSVNNTQTAGNEKVVFMKTGLIYCKTC